MKKLLIIIILLFELSKVQAQQYSKLSADYKQSGYLGITIDGIGVIQSCKIYYDSLYVCAGCENYGGNKGQALLNLIYQNKWTWASGVDSTALVNNRNGMGEK